MGGLRTIPTHLGKYIPFSTFLVSDRVQATTKTTLPIYLWHLQPSTPRPPFPLLLLNTRNCISVWNFPYWPLHNRTLKFTLSHGKQFPEGGRSLGLENSQPESNIILVFKQRNWNNSKIFYQQTFIDTGGLSL